jgi:hypothetical protein
MKLRDLPLPVGLQSARQLALVFSPALAARLQELHAAHGSSNCVPFPLTLSDGRLMLGADVLTEIEPGGLLSAMWEAADKAALGEAVEVLPMAEALALLPADPPPT